MGAQQFEDIAVQWADFAAAGCHYVGLGSRTSGADDDHFGNVRNARPPLLERGEQLVAMDRARATAFAGRG